MAFPCDRREGELWSSIPSLLHQNEGQGRVRPGERLPLSLTLLFLAMEPEDPQRLCRERNRRASGLWRGNRVTSCGVSWTRGGTLSFAANRWKPQEGCQLMQRLRCPQGVSFRGAKAEAWGRCSCPYLAFYSRSLSGALSLRSLESTVTGSGISAHPGTKDHPLYPQGHGQFGTALL